MQPFVAAEKVKDAYQQYIETSFPIQNEVLRGEFRRLVAENRLLWQDPFISLARPGKKGATFDELVARGVLDKRVCAAQWGFDDLWQHQAQAVERLAASRPGGPRNTIVATGTGSGKTQAFLIPIVDDCLRHPQPPGVRAVIVYPMNALANDQLDRLRRYLAGTGVTFGRYTGDTPFSDEDARNRGVARPSNSPAEERYTRKEIQQEPPQILITNYVMLELLLLRKEDQKIFHGVKPRYLVMDEAHTYTGILGAEVACLIRRLKEHTGLRPGELACVATSATIGGEEDAGGTAPLIRFAADLFGERFDDDAIVREAYEDLPQAGGDLDRLPDLTDTQLAEVNPERLADVRTLAQRVLGVELAAEGDAAFVELYHAIEGRPAFAHLEAMLEKPQRLSGVVARYAERLRPGADRAAVEREVMALLLLGSAARKPDSGDPPETRFQPKIHLVVRSLTPLSICLDPACGRLLTDGATTCDGDHDGQPTHALTLGLCRSCGADFRLGTFVVTEAMRRGAKGKLHPIEKLDIRRVGAVNLGDAGAPDSPLQTMYLYPKPLAADDGEDDDEEELQGVRTADYVVCPTCLQARPYNGDDAVCENPQCPACGKGPLPRFTAFLRGSHCPVCHAQGKGRRPEIITPLRSGGAPSIAVLIQGLFPVLAGKDIGAPEASEKRLLVFADSRQDTAHQAGYLRDRYQVFTQRQIVYQTLKQHEEAGNGPIALPDLAREVFSRTQERFKSETDAMNLLTAVEDFDDGSGEFGFYEPGQVIGNSQRQQAIKRLGWDLSLEFTDRATTRYSLEREGLTTVRYARLDETVAERLPDFAEYGVRDAQTFEALMYSILDIMRTRKAVNYAPFRDYLDFRSTSVQRREARPTREVRRPVGFNQNKESRTGAYRVDAWYNTSHPGTHQTVIYNMVSRVLPHLAPKEVTAVIDKLVGILDRKGYIKQEEIGLLTRQYGKRTTHAYQVNEKLIEVTTEGERYRCPTCRQSRSYVLYDVTKDEPICQTYRCAGKPEPYTPEPDSNFYVHIYKELTPERLFPVEHSGQLENDQRVKIEEKFKAGLVNTLVCTPTLELGVDIGDLVALLMRNVPPTPANYAQRAGRAGRKRRTALILSHAGLGSHDSYFFQTPEDMITGAIRAPLFLLDNPVVVNRHINSLILEKLTAEVPDDWVAIRTEEGDLRPEVLRPFEEELAQRGSDIQTAVERAFVREQEEGGLPWLTPEYVAARVGEFVPGLQEGLEHWCERYREIYEELRKRRQKVVTTQTEAEQERQLRQALLTLQNDRRYYPLSYLAQVGFLPRYGFSGGTVTIRDENQHEISQAAAVGITEYAPGNVVYVSGRKRRVTRVIFPGGAKDDPQQNAQSYRYCPQCSYATADTLANECPHCHELLTPGRYVDYEAGSAYGGEAITQDDEYRSHESYDLVTYLRDRESEPTADDKTLVYAGWEFAYSRLREIEIFNRGARERSTDVVQPFKVCLECGMWRDARRNPQRDGDDEGQPTGHMPGCSVTTWDPEIDPRVTSRLHLRAGIQGDVVEIQLPEVVAADDRWIETFAQALKLGMQLEYFVAPHEIESFTRRWSEDGKLHASLVFYDTMPGGTGYLQRLVEHIPHLAERVLAYLDGCECEQACYRCLKEFWNQRVHALLDKGRVRLDLEMLANAGRGVALPPVDVRRQFESFLEEKFYTLLKERGVPLPKAQTVLRTDDGKYIMRADFTYDQPPLVILLDGRAFHASDVNRVIEDLDRRNELTLSGRRLLEFTYWDVVNDPDGVVEKVRLALSSAPPAGPLPYDPSDAATRLALDGFVAALKQGAPQLEVGARLRLAGGESLVTLGVDASRRLAVVLADPDRWCHDGDAWQHSLTLHNAARLAGWRVIRVPQPWLGTPQGTALAQRLVATEVQA